MCMSWCGVVQCNVSSMNDGVMSNKWRGAQRATAYVYAGNSMIPAEHIRNVQTLPCILITPKWTF